MSDFAEMRLMRDKLKKMTKEKKEVNMEVMSPIVAVLTEISETMNKIAERLDNRPIVVEKETSKKVDFDKVVSKPIEKKESKLEIDFEEKEFIPEIETGHSSVRVKQVETKKKSVKKDTSAFDAVLGDKK